MLYHFLKFIIQVTVGVYFKDVVLRNANLIPKTGPLIIVPNHPSSYMDALVVGSIVNRKLYFLTRGETFNTPLKRWILKTLHMIPVYRKDKTPELVYKNDEVFQKCFDLLSGQGSFLIFPEGLSKTERRLREIKTGAARIALGAEAQNNFELNVKVLPLGLNYSDPHKFRSELYINIATPISVVEFKEAYELDERDGVRKLTDHIKSCIETHTIAIENEENETLVAQIEMIYKADLLGELGIDPQDKDRSFLLSKEISEAVEFIQQDDPAFFAIVRTTITDYLTDLNRLKLKDELVRQKGSNNGIITSSLITLGYFIFGFPLYLYGLINNYLPYKTPDLILKLLSGRPDFIGSVTMTSGILTFLVFYSLQIILVSTLFNNALITFLYSISLPISGFITFHYWKYMLKARERFVFISLFYAKSGLIADLIKKRDRLIDLLEQGKQKIQNVSQDSS